MKNISKISGLKGLVLVPLAAMAAGCGESGEPKIENYPRNHGTVDSYSIDADHTGDVFRVWQNEGYSLIDTSNTDFNREKPNMFTTFPMSDSTEYWAREVIEAQRHLRYNMDRDIWKSRFQKFKRKNNFTLF